MHNYWFHIWWSIPSRGHDSVLIQTQPGLVLLPNTEYSPKSGRNWKRLQGSEMNEWYIIILHFTHLCIGSSTVYLRLRAQVMPALNNTRQGHALLVLIPNSTVNCIITYYNWITGVDIKYWQKITYSRFCFVYDRKL